MTDLFRLCGDRHLRGSMTGFSADQENRNWRMVKGTLRDASQK
jgi:hypothetical protein